MNQYVYHHAQICECGHVICSDVELHPEQMKDFCPICGAKAMTHCPSCGSPFLGNYYSLRPVKDSVRIPACDYSSIEYHPINTGEFRFQLVSTCSPCSYCYHCSSPLPWTESLLNAAEKIVEMSDTLTKEQKQTLKKCFPNMLTETAESSYSTLIAQKLISSLNPIAQGALRNTLQNDLIPLALSLLKWTE